MSQPQHSTHDPKRRALGKGLESLLPGRPTTPVTPALPDTFGKPLEIPLEQIVRNPYQTRSHFDQAKLDELAQSIAASGVVQPIVVKRLSENHYQLLTGERRWLASAKANKKTIPAIIRQVSDEQALEMTIVENLQRADLNPMEQARAYQRLSSEFKMTQEQMATRTGKERASVSNFLRLLKLPEPVQHQVETGNLTFGHAKALLSLDSAEAITAAAKKALSLSFSVRQTESYVQGLLNPEQKTAKTDPPKPEDPNVRDAQDLLQRRLGLKVRIEDKKGKGRVIIEYSGLEDFDSVLSALGHE